MNHEYIFVSARLHFIDIRIDMPKSGPEENRKLTKEKKREENGNR